jgi:hypothetical protein
VPCLYGELNYISCFGGSWCWEPRGTRSRDPDAYPGCFASRQRRQRARRDKSLARSDPEERENLEWVFLREKGRERTSEILSGGDDAHCRGRRRASSDALHLTMMTSCRLHVDFIALRAASTSAPLTCPGFRFQSPAAFFRRMASFLPSLPPLLR